MSRTIKTDAPTEHLPADVGDILLDEFRAVVCRRKILTENGAGTDVIELVSHPDIRSVETKLDEYCASVHQLGNLSALCLSGGGIRSAAFSLGIIQGLAKRDLLAK